MQRDAFRIGLALFLVGTAINAEAALRPQESDEFNGNEAPDFTIRTSNGSNVSLKDFKGRPVLLNFFASWCPPCRAEIGQLTKLHEQYATRGLAIIGMASDSKMIPQTPAEQERKDVAALVQSLRIPYPVGVADDRLAREYKFRGIPTVVVIAASGKIVKTFYGYHSAQTFEKVLEPLLSTAKTAAVPAPTRPAQK